MSGHFSHTDNKVDGVSNVVYVYDWDKLVVVVGGGIGGGSQSVVGVVI